MPLHDMWMLSQDWYGDRLTAAYEPKTVTELQGLLGSAGLTDSFWNLRAAPL